ncbi:Subtilisin-like protease SBT1.7, partial [Cucurbita argyrosperma subsp. argyrosperma]
MHNSNTSKKMKLQWFLLFLISFAEAQRETYIIHMDRTDMPRAFDDHFQWYDSSLKSVSDSAQMLYSYNTVVHGFSTRLTTPSIRGGENAAPTTIKYTRTLTNKGTPSTYKATVTSKSPSVKIVVEPQTLSFVEANEQKSYTVTFVASPMPSGTESFARLEWSDGKHIVGSPIAFTWT